ncbi:MAG: hypothetical protein KGP10_03605 [Actinomycetales bacterium]|nr:hypothetical protein [Actinomycetales bacterium]
MTIVSTLIRLDCQAPTWAWMSWAADRSIFLTRSRPYRKNDQATVESKNNHLVRTHAFFFRYDSPEELRVLNRLLASGVLSRAQEIELTARPRALPI